MTGHFSTTPELSLTEPPPEAPSVSSGNVSSLAEFYHVADLSGTSTDDRVVADDPTPRSAGGGHGDATLLTESGKEEKEEEGEKKGKEAPGSANSSTSNLSKFPELSKVREIEPLDPAYLSHDTPPHTLSTDLRPSEHTTSTEPGPAKGSSMLKRFVGILKSSESTSTSTEKRDHTVKFEPTTRTDLEEPPSTFSSTRSPVEASTSDTHEITPASDRTDCVSGIHKQFEESWNTRIEGMRTTNEPKTQSAMANVNKYRYALERIGDGKEHRELRTAVERRLHQTIFDEALREDRKHWPAETARTLDNAPEPYTGYHETTAGEVLYAEMLGQAAEQVKASNPDKYRDDKIYELSLRIDSGQLDEELGEGVRQLLTTAKTAITEGGGSVQRLTDAQHTASAHNRATLLPIADARAEYHEDIQENAKKIPNFGENHGWGTPPSGAAKDTHGRATDWKTPSDPKYRNTPASPYRPSILPVDRKGKSKGTGSPTEFGELVTAARAQKIEMLRPEATEPAPAPQNLFDVFLERGSPSEAFKQAVRERIGDPAGSGLGNGDTPDVLQALHREENTLSSRLMDANLPSEEREQITENLQALAVLIPLAEVYEAPHTMLPEAMKRFADLDTQLGTNVTRQLDALRTELFTRQTELFEMLQENPHPLQTLAGRERLTGQLTLVQESAAAYQARLEVATNDILGHMEDIQHEVTGQAMRTFEALYRQETDLIRTQSQKAALAAYLEAIGKRINLPVLLATFLLSIGGSVVAAELVQKNK